jgi:murein L,D-transpeptidase YcbB/YkuD
VKLSKGMGLGVDGVIGPQMIDELNVKPSQRTHKYL